MSSGGTPYIGSKISLVSKAKIRYEGFLYTIDTEESTVTLAKVKSFGTEHRVAENRVPERNEIYEYIVFRGSDIDDLHVAEGPKSRSNQVAQDPAIVQTGTTQPNMYQPQVPMQMGSHFPHQSYGPFGGIPTFGYPIGFRPSTGMPLSSVIGQNNERNSRSSPFDRSYRQSPSPPSNSTASFRHSHREVQEKRSLSPEMRREQHANDKPSGSQMEAPRAQREQKRNWRSRENEQQSDRAVQRNHDQSTVRKQNRDNEQQKPRSQQRENEDKNKEKTRSNYDQSRDRNKEQVHARSAKRNVDNKEVDVNDAKSNENSKTRNNIMKEKEKPSSTAQRKKETEEKEDSHQSHSQSADLGRGARGGRGRGRGMRRGRGRGSYHRTKFDQDFDFESSNAKFNKEEVERELLTSLKKNLSMKDEDDVIIEKDGGRSPSAGEDEISMNGDEYYYDKSKSFFDQISCDSANERPDAVSKRKERSLNVETFGLIPRHYRGRPYRGRGRGGRGRGYGRGHRGRRGQGESRAWVDYEFDFEAAGLRQGSTGRKNGGS